MDFIARSLGIAGILLIAGILRLAAAANKRKPGEPGLRQQPIR